MSENKTEDYVLVMPGACPGYPRLDEKEAPLRKEDALRRRRLEKKIWMAGTSGAKDTLCTLTRP
jgi:hypothetical protein